MRDLPDIDGVGKIRNALRTSIGLDETFPITMAVVWLLPYEETTKSYDVQGAVMYARDMAYVEAERVNSRGITSIDLEMWPRRVESRTLRFNRLNKLPVKDYQNNIQRDMSMIK